MRRSTPALGVRDGVVGMSEEQSRVGLVVAAFILIAILLLAVSSAQNVFASTEIAYDDGTPASALGPACLAVRFTVGFQARVVGIRFYPTVAVSGTAYVTGPDHVTILTSFPIVGVAGWQTISIPSPPVVSGDFYVAIQPAYPGSIAYDAADTYGRSYIGSDLAGLAPFTGGDWLLRALVDPVSVPAVGGIVIPSNNLAVLAPYLTMIALVAIAATIYVKRRRSAS